jgi:hypothetical protein
MGAPRFGRASSRRSRESCDYGRFRSVGQPASLMKARVAGPRPRRHVFDPFVCGISLLHRQPAVCLLSLASTVGSPPSTSDRALRGLSLSDQPRAGRIGARENECRALHGSPDRDAAREVIAVHARNVARWRKKKRGPDRLASKGAASTSGACSLPLESMAPQDSLETNHLAGHRVPCWHPESAANAAIRQDLSGSRPHPRPARARDHRDRPRSGLAHRDRPLPEPPKVTRLRRKRAARKRLPRLPPVVEALRRARDYQRRIATAEAKDRADLARQLGFSRARVTQVLYLMELAPEIQRWVEGLEPTSERPPVTERQLRDLARRWPDPGRPARRARADDRGGVGAGRGPGGLRGWPGVGCIIVCSLPFR